MALKFVTPNPVPRGINNLLYGPPGTGKSVGACSAPGPVFVLNAEGENSLRKARQIHGSDKIVEVEFEGAATLNEVYMHFKDGTAAEQTLAIDTVGEIHKKLLAEYGGERPTLQQHGDVNLKIERFVRSVRDLPIHVVLVAHEQLDDQDGESVRRPDTGGRKLPESVMAMMDVVAYTGVIPATEDSAEQYVGQLVSINGRRAKDRSGVLLTPPQPFRELDLTAWFEDYQKAFLIPADGSTKAKTNGGNGKATTKAKPKEATPA